jgi:carboxypeptidase C (cathepsin A)
MTESKPPGEKQDQEEKKPEPTDQIVVTHHTATISGVEVRYTVTAGTIVMKEEVEKKGEKEGESEGEKPKAQVFFVAYTRDDVENKPRRPLTFSFNGGPGSSSVWLHLGLLGPKRIFMDDLGNMTPPPFRLVQNEYSLLDVTDLVFIDPVSTGYSRPVVGEKARQFHDFKKDIESVGDFIRLFITRFKRWSSPIFVIGESYGTTRAAGLSGYLQERHGLYMNGIMLVSSVLDFSTLIFSEGNDLPFSLFLPSYTATAWFHKKLPPELQEDLDKTITEVKQFAAGEYLLALFKGEALSPAEKKQIIRKLARYTGLSRDYIDRTNLRIMIYRFVKELLREERRTVGRLDSRFKGIDRDAAGEYVEFDPSMANIMGPYTAMLYDYVRSELGFESDIPYEILNPKVWPWSYSDFENRFVNVSETLRSAMNQNPYLKIFVANGYFDLATPFFATEYTFNHLGLDPADSARITMSYYEAGHMMYIHIPSLAKMKKDLAAFLKSAA